MARSPAPYKIKPVEELIKLAHEMEGSIDNVLEKMSEEDITFYEKKTTIELCIPKGLIGYAIIIAMQELIRRYKEAGWKEVRITLNTSYCHRFYIHLKGVIPLGDLKK